MSNIQLFEISFVVECKELSCEQITAHLSMEPTIVRKADEWPDTIYKTPNLPERLRARNIWEFSISAETEDGIDNTIHYFSSQVLQAELAIRQLCQEFSTITSLVITLNANHNWRKDLTIPIKTLLLMHEINAEVLITLR